MSLQSDAVEIKQTLDSFTAQFGELDIHTQLSLDVLFELLYRSKYGKNLSLPGPKRQKGSASNERIYRRTTPKK